MLLLATFGWNLKIIIPTKILHRFLMQRSTHSVFNSTKQYWVSSFLFKLPRILSEFNACEMQAVTLCDICFFMFLINNLHPPFSSEWTLYFRKYRWDQCYCQLASSLGTDCFFIRFLQIFKTNNFVLGRKLKDIPGIYFKLLHPFLLLLFSKCVLHCTKWIILRDNDVGREFLITFKNVMMYIG